MLPGITNMGDVSLVDGYALIHPPAHDLLPPYHPQQLGAQLQWHTRGLLRRRLLIKHGSPRPLDLHLLIKYDAIFHLKLVADICVTFLRGWHGYSSWVRDRGRHLLSGKILATTWDGGIRVSISGLRLYKWLWKIVCFGWIIGHWFYKDQTDKWAVMATNMDGEPSPVEFFGNTFTKNSLGVCQAPNGSMLEQTKVLVDMERDWSHNIAITPIKYQLAWKILKCRIWCPLAYVLSATTLSWAQANRVTKSFYPITLPYLGINRNFPATLHYLLLHYFGI